MSLEIPWVGHRPNFARKVAGVRSVDRRRIFGQSNFMLRAVVLILVVAFGLAAIGCESRHDRLMRRSAAAKAEYRGERRLAVIASLPSAKSFASATE